MTTGQIMIAARGLDTLHAAQDDQLGSYDDLSDFELGIYFAKGERILYDLGEEAVERMFK